MLEIKTEGPEEHLDKKAHLIAFNPHFINGAKLQTTNPQGSGGMCFRKVSGCRPVRGPRV